MTTEPNAGTKAKARPKRSKAAKPPAQPDFLTASELARRCNVRKTETIDQWVAKGTFPPAWCWLGCKRVWRADHYSAFVETGRWPDEAWKRDEK